jgi:hypothetical protein
MGSRLGGGGVTWVLLVQEINPSPDGSGKTVTVGEFVRDVFLEQVPTLHACPPL